MVRYKGKSNGKRGGNDIEPTIDSAYFKTYHCSAGSMK